jgi:hypothetical protein
LTGPAWSDRDMAARVDGTLELLGKRGYNPQLDRLSRVLLGGSADIDELEHAIETMDQVLVEDGFVYQQGTRHVEMCQERVAANGTFKPLYQKVAIEYTRDLVEMCPWIKSVMLVGSTATGGVCKGDDLDLNLIVANGRKYTTHMIGSLLNRKYSLRYGQDLGVERTAHYRIPMAICLNIVWEESQVMPFQRQDEQVAYELFSSEVLHGEDYFQDMLRSNQWLQGYFPQMFNGSAIDATPGLAKLKTNGNGSVGFMERLSRGTLFNFERVVRMYLSRRGNAIQEMDYYEELKQPYGLYDLPNGDNGHDRTGD